MIVLNDVVEVKDYEDVNELNNFHVKEEQTEEIVIDVKHIMDIYYNVYLNVGNSDYFEKSIKTSNIYGGIS